MMTVITETRVKPGQEPQWDQAFRERLAHAQNQPGWIGTELLIPADEPDKRVVVGTWESQDHWKRWHTTDPFQRTREQMNAATESDGQEHWYEVTTMATGEAPEATA